MQVKISQAIEIITDAIKAKVVPMLKGSPGTGKSQIIYQIAEAHELEVIDLRLSQCDPTDLAGFPTIEGNKADYMPMKHFPIAGDPLPKGKRGWFLFLDEATSAPPAIQAAAYKLILDRMVGSHHLHPNVAMALAGNLMTDGAIVHEMSTALQSRMLHLELVVDVKEWNDWAVAKGIDVRITSYMNYRPDHLYTFKADHTDSTYACPRTWEFTDRILKILDPASKNALPMLAGTLSEGIAREFLVFCKIHEELLKPQQILANPSTVKVPTEPSVLYALSGSIASTMTADNAADFLTFATRMPMEFQMVCLKEAVRRHTKLMAHPAIQEWIGKVGKAFFS